MEFISDLKKDEYEEFVQNSKFNHFMQSYDFGQIRKDKGFIPHYVGLKDKGKIVCSALLLEKKLILGYSYLYSPRGYVIDFNDKKLVEEFTGELKKYAKSIKAIFIKIDPGVKLHNIDKNGNVTGDFDNHELVEFLESLNYKHLGYNLGFEHEQPRFTFRINLDRPFEEIYQDMHPTTRKILNKGNQYDLDLYIGDEKDIDDFYITMKETSKREGIVQAPVKYYLDFYKIFNKDGLSDIYIVKADIKKVKKVFKDKIKELDLKIKNFNSDKYKNKDKVQNKIKDTQNQLDKLKRELDDINKIKEKSVVLSSIITYKYVDKVWTVHGGNNSVIININANYLLYYTILKDAYDAGYKVMDCFGTCGTFNPDKNNPIFGIHSFKKRLGGEYTEFIGEFDLVVKPFMYFMFRKLIPIYRNIMKKRLKGGCNNEIS